MSTTLHNHQTPMHATQKIQKTLVVTILHFHHKLQHKQTNKSKKESRTDPLLALVNSACPNFRYAEK